MKSSITTLTLIISVLCFVFLSSCSEEHSSEPSEARVNAIAMHDDSGRLAKEFKEKLSTQFEIARTESDSSLFSNLLALDDRYKPWIKSLVKIPGTACNHEDGEHHHHDHAAEALLEEYSDEELLELQEEIHNEIVELIEDLDVLVSSK